MLGELVEAVAPLVHEVVVVEVLGDDDVQHGHAERGIGAAGWVESEQVLSNDRWKDALPSIPSRRLGKLSEIAESVAFLCNDKVSYINGEILDVNGGIIMD